ncbi:right-handed parallel beta-helix repeat-containing protein [Brevibacillus sp. H7]|uniref:right-handed parallel beta-helix repeat-containing protein n=1 Tax=Brevibacillus sp. H7 TaxID=3349138 RepID=UPI00380523AA
MSVGIKAKNKGGENLFRKGNNRSIHRLLLVTAIAVWTLSGLGIATAAPISLQAMVDQAKPGETITIPAGKYEGPIRVEHPVVLQAQGTVEIISTGSESVMTILSDRVTVRGIHIVDTRLNGSNASLVVKGSHNVLERITIETMGTGIQLRDAHDNTLRELRVVGKVEDSEQPYYSGGHNHGDQANPTGKDAAKRLVDPVKKGNGIDLDQSHRNRIVSSSVDNMFDGIYLENSNFNYIENNRVERSRYGYHFMGVENMWLLHNTGSQNVTGAMLMETTKAVVRDNRFVKQSDNPNSQGILLFDVTDSQIVSNRIEGNRVGMYVEKSSGNRFLGNQIKQNFIGMQVRESSENVVTKNDFVSNVIQAQAQDSKNNKLDGNYWDNMQGIDLDEDGQSNLPYEMNPFFLALTEAVPPYQLFFQAPGFVFLEGLFTTGSGTTIRDEAPLMRPALAQMESPEPVQHVELLGLSTLLILGTCLNMYVGVRRK